MEHAEFRIKGKEVVDFVADYLESIRDHQVFPGVKPGFLHKALPKNCPQDGEPWDEIFKDFNEKVMPGITHWQSPQMHGYFPNQNSYPAIISDILTGAMDIKCFTWACSPAATELETISTNWLGKMIGLPETFLHTGDQASGGGVLVANDSEGVICSLLAARTRALKNLSKLNQGLEQWDLLGHLVAYCSDQAHSSVEKAARIGMVHLRFVETDEHQSMRGDKLETAILRDKAKGLVPFWVCGTLGSPASVAFDSLREIGEVCRRHSAWLHVHAGYAGCAFICPEYRHWLNGVELADSFGFNPASMLQVNFDCSAFWVKSSAALHQAFTVDPIYLQHENSGKAIDYRPLKVHCWIWASPKSFHRDLLLAARDRVGGKLYELIVTRVSRVDWQIGLSRRFRAVKLWAVIKKYGVKGLQKSVRENFAMCEKFEELVRADPRFQIPQKRNLGVLIFRLKGDNALSEQLLKEINVRGRIHVVPGCFKNIYFIRFAITSSRTTEDDINNDWLEIQSVASKVLTEKLGSHYGNLKEEKRDLNVKMDNPSFSTSVLLVDSPMSPRIVNGTHVALNEDLLHAYSMTLAQMKPLVESVEYPEMKKRIRGLKVSGQGNLETIADGPSPQPESEEADKGTTPFIFSFHS